MRHFSPSDTREGSQKRAGTHWAQLDAELNRRRDELWALVRSLNRALKDMKRLGGDTLRYNARVAKQPASKTRDVHELQARLDETERDVRRVKTAFRDVEDWFTENGHARPLGARTVPQTGSFRRPSERRSARAAFL